MPTLIQPDLFAPNSSSPSSLLPKDGTAYHYGSIMPSNQADQYFLQLQNEIDWQPDQLWMMGKRIQTRRLVAWYGSQPFQYGYSRTEKTALLWTDCLLRLKKLVEIHTQSRYNSCLLNFYDSGEVGMGWHTDKEKQLVQHGSIASLSFGAARRFAFRHLHSAEQIKVELAHGSLLEMKDQTQDYWQHALLKSSKIKTARINLTFRQIRED
ncbi:MAG: alpha-ketoglutarate-dependent dioxygenase AlkB [Pseudomonadota bacterium]|nr:alpha-ketoglutarate-dependent dioxygenase AlkB [Pseudomonadota bacterium]